MDEQDKTLQDYLAIVSRRKIPMLGIIMAVFLMGVVAALLWPPTYLSSATILIKEQEIPTELVRSTVTSFAAQRIQTISQRVMTRGHLLEIIEKYNLYVKDRKNGTTEEILDKMRNDISLDMIDANVIDPRSGRPMAATIAFSLSFESENPGAAQKVAGELTSLFLAENLKTRKEKASETYIFLTDESNKLSRKIADLEGKLAEFKENNSESLPELKDMNMSILERTDRELVLVETELNSQKERKFYLQSQLSQINPLSNMRSATGQPILDPASRLKSLESELASLSAKYSEEHPDVIKIKREIEGLRTQTGVFGDMVEKAKTLTDMRARLGVMLNKYSATHPDVISLKKSIAQIENEIKQRESQPEQDVMKLEPDNPAYISIKSQLNVVDTEIESLNKRKEQLKNKLSDYERRIARSPQVEREYLELQREYASTARRFQDIKSRQMEAEIGQALEKESKGESFLLIDPAQFPERPVKPNRIAIVFIALVFSIICGIGYALVAEAMDASIRSVSGVTAMLTAAPLAVIPTIYTARDYYRRRRMNRLTIGIAVTGFVLVILAIHFLYSPLDVLWFRSVRKAENIIGI